MPRKTKSLSKNYDKLQHSAIFTSIYSNNVWGGEKRTFYSGPGSHNEYVNEYADKIVEFVLKNEIRKIIEIGCGDFVVSKKILQKLNWSGFDYSYVGYDVVPSLITRNKANYETSKIKFRCKNACNDKLEEGDLLIIRQVLQHLNNKSILKIVKKFFNYKYILLTEHQPSDIYEAIVPNIDKSTGASTRLQFCSGVYIDKEPFNCDIKSLIYSIPEKSYGFEAKINTFIIEPGL